MHLKFSSVLIAFLLIGFATPALAQSSYPYAGWQKGPWKVHSKEKGNITVYINDSVPTSVEAIRVDTILPYPADQLFPIIVDPERAKSYSFIEEFVPVENHGNWGYLYQRVSSTGIQDRDFTVRLHMFEPRELNQGAYGWRWVQDNSKGPKPKKGVVRAKVVAGSYILQPIENGTKTLVSYRLWFDPTTWVPNFLVNSALRDGCIETVRRLREDAEKKFGKR